MIKYILHYNIMFKNSTLVTPTCYCRLHNVLYSVNCVPVCVTV